MKRNFKNFDDYCRFRKTGESRVSVKDFNMAKKFVDKINGCYGGDYGWLPDTVTEEYGKLKLVYFDGQDHLHITFYGGISMEQIWGDGEWIGGITNILDTDLSQRGFNKALYAFENFFLGDDEELADGELVSAKCAMK